MDPIKIIQKYYDPKSRAYHFLIHHSKLVTKKALEVAERVKHLNPDLKFIEEASMLHDVGIFLTNAPEIGCYGEKEYICHGYMGREILEKKGFPKHALVCERHVGIGLTVEDIERQKLPVPMREMVPVTLEEQIICFADKFFSKDNDNLLDEKPVWKIREIIAGFGEDKLKRFDEWLKRFGE